MDTPDAVGFLTLPAENVRVAMCATPHKPCALHALRKVRCLRSPQRQANRASLHTRRSHTYFLSFGTSVAAAMIGYPNDSGIQTKRKSVAYVDQRPDRSSD
jgi:hypothetical protein